MLTSGRPAPAVVIVAYKSDGHLGECLAALGPDGLDVTVLDNDAAASTRELCTTAGVDYVAVPGNPGFATAVNLGLAGYPGRDVLLLNPDARLAAADLLRLQLALHTGRRAAVGPRLVDTAGVAQPADWPVPSPWQVWSDALGSPRWHRGPRFVTGAVLLLRAEAVTQLGGLDERFFLYAEEADWQLRAQRAGWSVAVVQDVTAVHAGWASSSDATTREDRFAASGRAFATRWYGPVGVASMRVGSLVAALRRTVSGSAGDRDLHRRAVRRALRRTVPAPTRRSVVHVVRSDAFAGVESSIATMAREQHARGWRVLVVGGDQERLRVRLPVGVLLLPGDSVLQVLRSLWSVGRVDVVHAHMTAAEAAALLLRRRSRGRFVVTRHFAAPRGSSPVARVVGRAVARGVDAQVAISGFVAASIEGPATVVPNGVPVPVHPAALPERDRVVVVLQRHEAEKQTAVAIRAWALSSLPSSGWRLVLYGTGTQTGELRDLAAALGCGSTVQFAGFTDTPRDVLARAGLLLATAPAEPFGLSVVEAMAAATPVLAADGGAHREVLGADGRYFAPGDVAGCAAELEALVADDGREGVGERLRARHRELFTPARQVDRLTEVYRSGYPAAPRVALLSLEPWDDVWRRNQHLAAQVLRSGAVRSLVFVEPPRGGLAPRARRTRPMPGVEVVTPPLLVPRRYGGHGVLGVWLRRALRDVDVVWVNDPVAGAGLLTPGRAVVYDVTDDWRALEQSPPDRARIVAAEDLLAGRARTVVCSQVLAQRWAQRYGVTATIVGNGVDVRAVRDAEPVPLDAAGPHAVYVGTVHPNRVDVELVLELAAAVTVHLVGPDGLDAGQRATLQRAGVRLHGPVPSSAVASWLVAADVLICPHVVDGFTLSLDAIKAHEYLATDRPVVATPSSGFQSLSAPGLDVVPARRFVAAVRDALGTGGFVRTPPPDWSERAAEFAAVLHAAAHR